MESWQYAYLFGALALLPFWLGLFLYRKDIRKQMLIMSFTIGVLSLATTHYWWTVDWWQSPTVTGTKVGVEDFIAGFLSGGIMAVVYEVLFSKQQYKIKNKNINSPDVVKLLLFMAFTTSFLFWGMKLTSFWASTVALISTAVIMFYYRRDLLLNGLVSGVLMTAISGFSYATIVMISPEWVNRAYKFDTLSGFLISGIPVEEFIFWFLAGLFFGPLYEYWQGKQLRLRKRL